MRENMQDRIMTELEEKIDHLKVILKETIEKNSDAKYELKDLKLALEKLSENQFINPSKKMLFMASEWEDGE